jgi:hypothetical protein
MTEYDPALWTSALYALCEQQATLDAALLQDVLSLFPLGSHRVSATAFVDLAEAADGTRTAEVGSIAQTRDVDGLTVEAWCMGSQRHRQDGPAWRKWVSAGRLVEEEWFVRGEQHRGDGPAWRKWDSAGRRVEEVWYVRGVLHRKDGPAWQGWNREGRLILEAWYVRGQLHRKDGPAWRTWDENGRLLTSQRWVRGIQIEG